MKNSCWAGLGCIGIVGCTVFDGLSVETEEDPTPQEPDAYLSTEDAAKVCGLLLSDEAECANLNASLSRSIALAVFSNFSQCMTWLAGPLDSERIGLTAQRKVLECIASSSQCGDFESRDGAFACLPAIDISIVEDYCGGTNATDNFCEEDVFSDCANSVAYDCSSAYFSENLTCNSNGAATDDAPLCAIADSDCGGVGNGPLDTYQCDGFVASFCATTGARRLNIDCSFRGMECPIELQMNQGVPIACVLSSSTCTDVGRSRCVSVEAQACDGIGWSVFNCEKFGGACDDNGSDAACVTDTECSVFDSATCDDSVVQYCLAGKITTLDCATLDNQFCDVTENDARCVPNAD